MLYHIPAPLRPLLCTLTFLLLAFSSWGQAAVDKKQSVMVYADVQEDPPQITLRWVQDLENSGFTIYRKFRNASSWGTPIGTAVSTATSFTDTNVQPGLAYEYRVLKSLAGYGGGSSNGYLYAGMRVPPVHRQGSSILVVDNTFAQDLAMEIARLEQDMEEEGWRVRTLYVDRDAPVTQVKALIQQAALGDNATNRTLFLLGRVPVPYSGNIAPDGHVPDHQGAWPCDGYYGDLDGIWTDNMVNVTDASQERNRNIPGDGKFDQSTFPSALELGVGRVDFANMPAFPQGELELLRNYLNKNHAWRKGLVQAQERGLVQNNFTGLAEGFGQNGWKNFTAMFGEGNVHDLPYRSTLQNQSYLWSYGCGPGSYTSAGGITTTSNFVTDSLQTVFTMLFGSYFGDWDSQNNLLRAALATGPTLTNAWAARPNWMFHHMALGDPIGHAARISMSNSGALYQSGFGAAGVHTALLGDPTLTMHNWLAPGQLSAVPDGFNLDLDWSPVEAAEGYFVYRQSEGQPEFSLLTDEPITATSYTDFCSTEGTIRYLVRATRLRETASGNYYLLGPGASVTLEVDQSAITAQAAFDPQIFFDRISPSNLSQNALSYFWDFGDGQTDNSAEPQHLYTDSGEYTLCLTAFDACYATESCLDITVISSMPDITPDIQAPTCADAEDGDINLQASGGAPDPEFLWNTGATSQNIAGLGNGTFQVTVSSATGKSAVFGPYILATDSLILSGETQPASGGQANGSFMIQVGGGVPPYTFDWCDGSTTSSGVKNLAAGICCVTVTDGKGCSAELCEEILEVSLVDDHSYPLQVRLFPNPTQDRVRLDISGALATEPWEAQLLDAQGRVLEIRTGGAENIADWDIRSYPAGRYWLQVKSGREQRTLPIDKIGER
jgi:PKD repeat protein